MAEKSRYVTAGITGSTSEIADSNNRVFAQTKIGSGLGL